MIEEQKKQAPKQQSGIIRVSISDAARLFGVNAQTIRRAVANKEISYVVVAGRYKINFESLVKWSQQKTTIKRKTETCGIGQYVDKWKIKNTLYSPSPKLVQPPNQTDSTQSPT
jgi:excisionase family DNA binding protein